MQEPLEESLSRIAELTDELEVLRAENKLLNQEKKALLKRLFGSKSEKLDPNQLNLLLGLIGDETQEAPPEVKIDPPQSEDQAPQKTCFSAQGFTRRCRNLRGSSGGGDHS
ncbi:MAG: hypothetical protein GKR87_10455 [Kiritimatiellae bacterium]|nr:hypothetical protein [Kiritimatiellia bacterium]